MSQPAFGLNRWNLTSPAAFARDVRAAEELGWGYAFTGSNPLLVPDPYVLLATAAASTSTIRLGTLLENPVVDHPASAAGSIATVDLAAPGRAVLGLGIGDTAVRWLNKAPAKVSELEAATVMIKTLLGGEEIEVGAVRPARLRHPRPVPVWIAAGGPRTLRMAGRVADGVFLRVGRHPGNLSNSINEVRAGAIEANRNPDDIGIGLIFHIVVPDDAKTARAIARSVAAGYYEYSPSLFDKVNLPWNGPPIEELKRQVYPDFHHADDLVASGELVEFLDDEIIDSFALFGSAEEIAEQINATLALGFRIDIIIPHPIPTPSLDTAIPRSLPPQLSGSDYKRWFAREVMPRVSGSSAT